MENINSLLGNEKYYFINIDKYWISAVNKIKMLLIIL